MRRTTLPIRQTALKCTIFELQHGPERQTDGQTDGLINAPLPPPFCRVGVHNKLLNAVDVCRSSFKVASNSFRVSSRSVHRLHSFDMYKDLLISGSEDEDAVRRTGRVVVVVVVVGLQGRVSHLSDQVVLYVRSASCAGRPAGRPPAEGRTHTGRATRNHATSTSIVSRPSCSPSVVERTPGLIVVVAPPPRRCQRTDRGALKLQDWTTTDRTPKLAPVFFSLSQLSPDCRGQTRRRRPSAVK